MAISVPAELRERVPDELKDQSCICKRCVISDRQERIAKGELRTADQVQRVAVSWSGGKDSALTLAELRASAEYDVVALLTNIDERDERVLAHRVRRELIEAQAASVGLPLLVVSLPALPSNELYERRTLDALSRMRDEYAVTHIAFGDLFLADVRGYRERLTALAGLTPLFPLWQRDTTALADEFIDQQFRARLIAVDTTQLAADFVGRELDAALLTELPNEIDPCGERGEFHTFVYGGPIFREPIAVTRGERHVTDDRFAWCDLRLLRSQSQESADAD